MQLLQQLSSARVIAHCSSIRLIISLSGGFKTRLLLFQSHNAQGPIYALFSKGSHIPSWWMGEPSLECATFICFGRQFCEVERNKARLCHSHVRVKDRSFADTRFEDHNLSNWTILSTGEDPKTGVIHVKLPDLSRTEKSLSMTLFMIFEFISPRDGIRADCGDQVYVQIRLQTFET